MNAGDVKDRANESEYLQPMQSIGYLTRINFRAFSRALGKLIAPHGVSAGQWRFLRVLWEQDDITQRELSDRVGIKEATTVRAVQNLERAGLATRSPCTEDRRKIRIKLTGRAKRLRDKLLPMVVTVNEQALEGVSKEDIETTRRVLAQTYRNLASE